ncbi:hypothetical protein [Pseudohoeflea coraliihabitans]
MALADVRVKLSGIVAGDGRSGRPADLTEFNADMTALIRETISSAAEIGSVDHLGAGFAVVHRGEAGLWLLLHLWLAGGIATQTVWRSDLGGTPEFHRADPTLMACVWELAVIDFERRAWMETVMSGASLETYMQRRLPRGDV